ncbi:MAG: serine/threonine protein kinase [Candidatus Sericytochromatia bacterium]
MHKTDSPEEDPGTHARTMPLEAGPDSVGVQLDPAQLTLPLSSAFQRPGTADFGQTLPLTSEDSELAGNAPTDANADAMNATDLDIYEGMGTLPLPEARQIDPGPAGVLETGQKLELNGRAYRVVRRLGKQTGESQVFLIDRPEGTQLVLKYYFPGFHPKMHILQDLMALQHPGIIRILDSGYYKSQFFELLEFAGGGDLLQHAPIKDPDMLRLIVADTAEALKFCHEHQIVHRDIKPDNLFYKSADCRQVLIGDFGISSKISGDELNQLTSQSRTPIYAAPEVYQSIAGKTVIQPAVDYYSLGMTLLYLWTGKNPFKGLNEFQIMNAKSQGQLQPPADMPEPISRLIKGLLTVRTAHRWAYAEIQRWLAGEQVAVYEAPQKSPGLKPFKFGSDAGGNFLEAANPSELAALIRTDPEKGAQYLQTGAVKTWLDQLGEQDLALEIVTLTEDFSGVSAAHRAVYTLDPAAPLLLGGREVPDPKALAGWILGSAEDWGPEGWPASYQSGLDLLESGEMLAWLKARGHQELVSRWSELGLPGTSTQGLESMLRLLDPALPPVRMVLDQSPLQERFRIKQGTHRDLTLSFSSEGRGVPRTEMTVYAGPKWRQSRLLSVRQGSFSIRLGSPGDKAYGGYEVRLVLAPDASTALEGGSWTIPYKVSYPWKSISTSLLKSLGFGAAIGLAYRGVISYKYPKPLSSYFGTTVTPAQARSVKAPYLDYVFCGWVFVFLILLNRLVRS